MATKATTLVHAPSWGVHLGMVLMVIGQGRATSPMSTPCMARSSFSRASIFFCVREAQHRALTDVATVQGLLVLEELLATHEAEERCVSPRRRLVHIHHLLLDLLHGGHRLHIQVHHCG